MIESLDPAESAAPSSILSQNLPIAMPARTSIGKAANRRFDP
jgi:hypothetical protein